MVACSEVRFAAVSVRATPPDPLRVAVPVWTSNVGSPAMFWPTAVNAIDAGETVPSCAILNTYDEDVRYTLLESAPFTEASVQLSLNPTG